MLMLQRALCATLFLLLLSGCMLRPDQETLARADYGPYPTAYEQAVTAFMQSRLRDPESARYRFIGNPRQYFYGLGGEPNYGWRLCVKVNAKNGFGGYTGEQLHFLLLRNGVVRKHVGTGWAAEAFCEG